MADIVPWPRGRFAPVAGLLLTGVLLTGLPLAAPALGQQAAGDARMGRRLAAARCTPCHGATGMASQSDTPNLAGQNSLYLENQLRHFRSGDRVHVSMNAVARDLTDEQIASLAAWFTAIQLEVTVPLR